MRAILNSSKVLLALSYLGLVRAQGSYPEAAASTSSGYCGDATFINQSSTSSPLVSDCEALRQKILDSGDAYAFGCYGSYLAPPAVLAIGWYSHARLSLPKTAPETIVILEIPMIWVS